MGIANKTYLKAKEELEELEKLNMQMDEAKHKSVVLLSLKNCKVKSVKYMGKLLY